MPAVVRQTSRHTASYHGGHSSAPIEPKPSGARRSTRNKNNHNEEDPLGSVPDILQVDTVDDAIDKPEQVQRRQEAGRGKCFEPVQAPIRKIEKPQLKACSVLVGLETDIKKVVEQEKPKPKDKPKPKSKKSAAADKPKSKSKKIVAESVTPKETLKENIEPKEQTEKRVEIQKENKTEVVPNKTENGEPKEKLEKYVEIPEDKETEVVLHETENGEPSYEIQHVAAYVNNGETHDTEDTRTEEEKIQNIHDSFEIKRLEFVIEKVITDRLQVDSSQEKIKCLKDILELLDPEFIKVDFTDITHDGDASDKKDIEDEPVKPKKTEKRVSFNLDMDYEKHEEEMSQISKDTEEAIAKLDKVIEDEENKRHRIDAAYINFPCSQEKFDLYKPDTEDIMDEDEPETKLDPVTGIRTFTKKTHLTEEKDVNESEKKEEAEEQKKDETESKSEVVQPVEEEDKLDEEKKDETESKTDVVQPVQEERKLDEEKNDETESQSKVVEPVEVERKLDEEKKDETENQSAVVQPVQEECKLDEEKNDETESDILKPVEAGPKVVETEDKPDDSEVLKPEGVENEITDDGIHQETQEDSDADSNSNLVLTER